MGEREPLARARGDRRAPGHCTTPSPPLYRWWCGGGGGVVDRLRSLIFQRSYAMVPHRVPRILLYIAKDKFTPGTVSAYMPAVLPCCGAVCAFVFVPVLVRGSRRIVVWYNVLVCCVLSRSRRCGVFPGRVPVALLSFTVLLWCVCSRWYSRRLAAILFLYGGNCSPDRVLLPRCYPSSAFPGVPGAGTVKPRRVPVLACLLSYYHTTTLYRRIGSLFVQIPMFPRRS